MDEKQTREQIIDKALNENAGWKEDYIISEVKNLLNKIEAKIT